MAHHGYLSITGTQQGLISAGCSTLDSIGNKCQSAHLDEIMVLSFLHNLSNPGNIQHATHRPVLITKPVDKATPLLAQAASSTSTAPTSAGIWSGISASSCGAV